MIYFIKCNTSFQGTFQSRILRGANSYGNLVGLSKIHKVRKNALCVVYMSSEWNTWKQFNPALNQRDRYPYAQVVMIERSILRMVEILEDDVQPPALMGLTINVSNRGLCFLADWPPRAGEIFRIHLPLPMTSVTMPTLADVRWVRPLPFAASGLHMVGLKFIV